MWHARLYLIIKHFKDFFYLNKRKMPVRKIVRRRRRTRGYRSSLAKIPISKNFGAPQNMIVRWKFGFDSGDSHPIASTTGSYVDYAYRATSPYDPYAETGGAQPRNFDQYMAMYNKGVVLGSKISVTYFFSPASASSSAMSVGIVRKMAIADADAPLLVEGRHSTRKVLTGANDKVHCVMKYSYRDLCKDPNDYTDLEFSSGGNTTKQVYYHIGGFALNAQTQTCHFVGQCEYTVLLKEPINPAQS